MGSRIRCVLVSEMLQPYRIPVFNRIARDDRVDFEVLSLSVRETNRQWEIDSKECRFRYEVLPGKDVYIRSLDWGLHLNTGLGRRLDALEPEVVVGTGYVSPAYLTAQRWARTHNAGYVLWSGSTQRTSRIGKGPLRWMKKRFIGRCDSFLSYGTDATTQLISLGADPSRVVTGCNTVEIDRFRRIVATARREPGFEEWRKRFPEHLILYIGQMIDRKGVPDLIGAFQSIRQRDLGLVLVGDGPRKKRYQKMFAGAKNVFWEGYKQTQDLGPFLAAADVLVMPSRLEVWGLVVNEAMASGLPVIATTCAGATTDLVEEGVTGYSFEAGDRLALATLLKSVADHPERWVEMGRNASERIERCRPEDYADCFVEAVLLADRNRR